IDDSGDYMIVYEVADDVGFVPGGWWDSLIAWGPWDSSLAGQRPDTGTIPYTRFPATGIPKSAQFNDNLYIVNNVGRGLIFGEGVFSEFPLRATGEPSIIPLDTVGSVDGMYYYALRYTYPQISVTDSVLGNVIGPISSPVRVIDGMVELYNWPLPTRDLWHVASGDTVKIEILRTRGDVGILTKNDSLFPIDTITIHQSNYNTYSYRDTVSDDSLLQLTGIPMIGEWTDWIQGCRYIPDGSDTASGTANKIENHTAPGVPNFVGYGSLSGANQGLWDDSGMLGGEVAWNEAVGYAWMVEPIDTITHLPADSSRSIWLYQREEPDSYNSEWNSQGDSLNTGFRRSEIEYVTLAMPRFTGASNVMLNLYRAPLIPIRADSTRTWGTRVVSTDDRDPREGGGGWPYRTVRYETWRTYAADFEPQYYYYLGQHEPGDTVSDSLGLDSLQLRDPYRANAVPLLMSDVVASGNRLIAIDESHAYMSEIIDTMTRFNALRQIPVNPDIGDQNTAIWEALQGVVKVSKNKSIYDLYRSSGLWQIPERSAHFGVVAPLSPVSAPEGDYILSHDGVRLLTEGIYKSRSFIPLNISAPLANFREFDIAVMRNAVGIYFDDKYILSFPDLDTAFVCNKTRHDDGKISFGWTQWGLTMVGHAFYRVSDDPYVMPSDSLYFIKSGDPTIYVFGSSDRDLGVEVYWKWRSGPTNKPDGRLRYISDFSFFFESDETLDWPYIYSFYDHTGTLQNGDAFPAIDTTNYLYYDGAPPTGSLFWFLELQRKDVFVSTGTTIFEGIWMNLTREEHYGSQ
ncbi:hypothetical protein KAR91_05545, partial [Candidatus Pacearchaeota archaeon]|nr:hypothetical protein [Candidatus Pacearchaeota archaeon]